MRAIVSSFLVVVLLAIAWCVKTPVCAFLNVASFSANSADSGRAENALLREGPGALPFLHNGLNSTSRETRFHSAKVLIVMGESLGEAFLLSELKAHPEPFDGAGREAEALLIEAWDLRDGPNETYRKRLGEVEHVNTRMIETIQILNECLLRFPNWADGYARRARMYQQAGESYEAKRDALAALVCAPNHFDAMVTLGRVQMGVEAPFLALKCFERAILVNPRLKILLRSEIEAALKALEVEKEKKREEKRRNAILV
jgi:tetratricopeptide (TPR) repeat protein